MAKRMGEPAEESKKASKDRARGEAEDGSHAVKRPPVGTRKKT